MSACHPFCSAPIASQASSDHNGPQLAQETRDQGERPEDICHYYFGYLRSNVVNSQGMSWLFCYPSIAQIANYLQHPRFERAPSGDSYRERLLLCNAPKQTQVFQDCAVSSWKGLQRGFNHGADIAVTIRAITSPGFEKIQAASNLLGNLLER